MEKKYLTIKEVADAVGVSYQAIHKRLNTTLKQYVEEVEGRKVLRREVLREFTSTPSSTPSTTVEEGVESPSFVEELKRINRWNEELIQSMREEIKEKDKQISEMSVKIADLFETHQKLVENNQRLELNYQYLLNGGKPEEENEVVNVDGAPSSGEVIEEEQKKKGLFRRLFKN